MNQPDGDIFTLDEVALYLKAGKKTVYRLAQQGEIPGFKLGGTWRFRRTELNRWVATQIAKNTGRNISDSQDDSDLAASPEGVATSS